MDNNKAIVILNILKENKQYDIEVPLDITANDLIKGLNTAFDLKINIGSINECYLRCENPIMLIKGNKTLKDFALRNGTIINV